MKLMALLKKVWEWEYKSDDVPPDAPVITLIVPVPKEQAEEIRKQPAVKVIVIPTKAIPKPKPPVVRRVSRKRRLP